MIHVLLWDVSYQGLLGKLPFPVIKESPRGEPPATILLVFSHLTYEYIMRGSGRSLVTKHRKHREKKPASHAYQSIQLERAWVWRKQPQQLLAVRLVTVWQYKPCLFKWLSAGLPVLYSWAHSVSCIIEQTFIKFLRVLGPILGIRFTGREKASWRLYCLFQQRVKIF